MSSPFGFFNTQFTDGRGGGGGPRVSVNITQNNTVADSRSHVELARLVSESVTAVLRGRGVRLQTV